MTKDEELRAAIMGERDPRRLVELMTEYYRNPDCADGASRSLLFLHLGLLSGTIVTMLDLWHLRDDVDALRAQLPAKKKKAAPSEPHQVGTVLANDVNDPAGRLHTPKKKGAAKRPPRKRTTR